MEPVTTLILTALAFGAKEMASEAVKDSYRCLKELVTRKFAGDEEGERALTLFEKDQSEGREKLMEALDRSGIQADAEAIVAAQQVISHINPQQAASGKYNIQITGNIQGFVQGDHASVTMNFTDEK